MLKLRQMHQRMVRFALHDFDVHWVLSGCSCSLLYLCAYAPADAGGQQQQQQQEVPKKNFQRSKPIGVR